jgi:hypothetical protein
MMMILQMMDLIVLVSQRIKMMMILKMMDLIVMVSQRIKMLKKKKIEDRKYDKPKTLI